MTWTLGEIAERVGGEVVGDRSRAIEGVRTLEDAGPGDLSFLTHPRYLEAARESAAGALLVGRLVDAVSCDQILVANPSAALAQVLELFHPEPESPAGVHSTAVVGEDCRIDPTAAVGPYAVLGRRVSVGARAVIGAHVAIGDDCAIGAGSVLHPHSVLYRRTVVGERTLVHAGAVLGADGFGYAAEGADHRKIPQVGAVELGAEVEIGALSAVDRALLGTTSIGAGTKIDNLVQVGHNVRIGRGAILCGQAGVAGSTRLGDGVVLAGQAGVSGHLEIGDGARVAAKSAVYQNVAAGDTVAGIPAQPIASWRRQQALLRRLAEIWRRLLRLERPGPRGEEEP